MRRIIASAAATMVLFGGLAMAQEKFEIKKKIDVHKTSEAKVEQEQDQTGAMSAEMYAYLQELRKYDDPKQNAKRAAMIKAEQRRARLASQQWYGYSNLRPMVNPIPFMGTYSPMWAGSPYHEYYWYGASYTPSWLYVNTSQVGYGR